MKSMEIMKKLDELTEIISQARRENVNPVTGSSYQALSVILDSAYWVAREIDKQEVAR